MTLKARWLWPLLLTLLGFSLRLYQIDKTTFRGDEATTIQYWMLQPLSVTIPQQLTEDPHPILAYALYRGWGLLVGQTPLAARMLSALAGTLAIPLMIRFAQHITRSRWIAWISGFLWAIHPYLIWHSQDARNYALWSTASLAALWFAVRALDRDRPKDWLLYIGVASIAAYIYYLEAFMLGALSLFVLVAYWHQRRMWWRWLGAMFGVAILYTPWVIYLLRGVIRGDNPYTGTTVGFTPLLLLQVFPTWLVFGPDAPKTLANGLWVFLWLGIITGIIRGFQRSRKTGLLLLIIAFVPMLILSAVSLRINVLAPRYVLGVVPIYIVALVWSITTLIQRKAVYRVLGIGLLLLWVGVAGTTLRAYYVDFYKAPNWLALTDYLAERVSPNDLVIQASADASFGYHYHEVSHVPAQEIGLPAAPNQPASEIYTLLADASRDYPAIWIVARGFSDWPNYGVTEAWLDGNMQQIINTNADGLRIQQYRPWTPNLAEVPTESPLATFDEIVQLHHVEIIAPPQPTGEWVILTYWQPLATTQTPLKVFVHLVSESNPPSGIVAQDDHEPQLGRLSSLSWQVGDVYRDVFTLRGVSNLAEGDYHLAIGLYEPVTGERILTTTGEDHARVNVTLP